MTTKTHCPICNSLQAFRRKVRPMGPEAVEVYMKCESCKSETIIEHTDQTTLRVRSNVSRLKRGELNGVPVDHALARQRAKLSDHGRAR